MSRLTNLQNLPEPLVRAVEWSDRDREGCLLPVLGKRCGKCWLILPSSAYYRLRNGRLYCYCKECHQAGNALGLLKRPKSLVRKHGRNAMKRWRERNPELSRQRDLAWKAAKYSKSEAFRLAVSNKNKQYRIANLDLLKRQNKAWRSTPIGRQIVRVCGIRRKARLKSATMPDANKAVACILSNRSKRCFYCSIRLNNKTVHIEHKTPLCRGGLHTASNIVASCAKCNLRKGSRTAEEFISQ